MPVMKLTNSRNIVTVTCTWETEEEAINHYLTEFCSDLDHCFVQVFYPWLHTSSYHACTKTDDLPVAWVTEQVPPEDVYIGEITR